MVQYLDEPPTQYVDLLGVLCLSFCLFWVSGVPLLLFPSFLPPPLKGFFQHPTGLRPTRARRDFITNLVAAAKSGRPTDRYPINGGKFGKQSKRMDQSSLSLLSSQSHFSCMQTAVLDLYRYRRRTVSDLARAEKSGWSERGKRELNGRKGGGRTPAHTPRWR